MAIGLCAAARLSGKLGSIGPADVARVEALVAAHSLPIRLRSPLELPSLLAAMGRDKKVRAGAARFIVLNSLGSASVRPGVDPALVEACWREVGAVD